MPFGKDAVKDVSREVDVKDFITKEVPVFLLKLQIHTPSTNRAATARHEWVPRLSELWLA